MKTLFPPIICLALKVSLSLTLFVSATHSVCAQMPPAQIANISTRALCEKGDAVTVTEFAVKGPGTDSFCAPWDPHFCTSGFMAS